MSAAAWWLGPGRDRWTAGQAWATGPQRLVDLGSSELRLWRLVRHLVETGEARTTHRELAELAGVPWQSVGRMLRRFAQLGMIELETARGRLGATVLRAVRYRWRARPGLPTGVDVIRRAIALALPWAGGSPAGEVGGHTARAAPFRPRRVRRVAWRRVAGRPPHGPAPGGRAAMSMHFADDHLTVHVGDVRDVLPTLPTESVHCVVTSPPYWGLRDYGTTGQFGLESTPEEYAADMVAVFREVRRVLRSDGTLWLNLGDSYANDGKWGGSTGGKHVSALHGEPIGRAKRDTGLKPKDLVGIPWRVALALQADGWYLRSDIIWSKPNPMPESVTDRPTKAHEYVFLLTKSARYYYDADAVREPSETAGEVRGGGHKASTEGIHGHRDDGQRLAVLGQRPTAAGRNLRSVWTIATQPYPGAHFATFPEKLVEPCVKAGCPADGVVLDPFAGSGTTGRVANRLGRRAILIDLSATYIDQAMARNAQKPLGLHVRPEPRRAVTLRSSGAYRRAIMAQLLATYGPRCRADVCTLPTRDYPGPRTIGHAVALANGGTDAWANLRIEHATCNYRAGARGPRPRGQLLEPR